MLKKFLSSRYSFIFALVLGVVLAVGASVWATSVGTDITVTGKLTTSSTTASSTISYALGVATTTPGTTLSVVGSGYVTVGLGAGIATTTTGAIQNSGNALFGDAQADLVMLNAGSLVFNNVSTTTIVSSNANAFNIATSSANIPFLKFDTSNYRLGVSTTSPATTLSVGGAGHIYALGGLGVGLATTTAGAIENSGNVLFGDAAGDFVMSNAAVWVHNNAGTTTIPSGDTVSFAYATTSSGALVRFNTSNTRIGISSSTPGATLAVGGDGTAIIMGGATSSLSIQSTNTAGSAQRGGCIELESAEGGGAVFRLYATAAGVPAVWESGSCR